MARSIGPVVRRYWGRLSGLPGGRWLFSRLLGRIAPYTGTLGATVEQLQPGFCRVCLRDRHRVRNHLRSIHAIALANLAELATGLALAGSLPAQARAILTGFHVDYLHKARGTLYAESRCSVPPDNRECEYEVDGEVRDAAGTVVARARARWRVGPEPQA